jgi:glycosyltransferase involved in cell wall biosynthesis
MLKRAMEKRVSVIVCCYNMGGMLRQCLESLCRQTYSNREFIVVNDASTDDTPQVVSEYQLRIGNDLTLVTNPENCGVAGSRNVGIRHAQGDLIAFTDADCVAESDWLSEIVGSFARNVAAVGGRILNDDCRNIWELSEKGHNYVARIEGPVTYLQGCNMAFDATVLRSFMFNDEIKYGYEEALLCDHLVENGHRIQYNPRAVVHHSHRANLAGLLKQKYQRGYSSIWYRKKQRKFPMLKRHFLMLLSLALAPAGFFHPLAWYVIAVLLLAAAFSLFRDEHLFGAKRSREIWMTLPVLCGTELAHFAGAFSGLFVFRFRKTRGKPVVARNPNTHLNGEKRVEDAH